MHVSVLPFDDTDLGWRWDDASASANERIQSDQFAETKILVLDERADAAMASISPLSRHSEFGSSRDDLSANRFQFDASADREKIVAGEGNQVSDNAKPAQGDSAVAQIVTSNFSHVSPSPDSSTVPPAKMASPQDSTAAERDSLAAFSVDQLLHHSFAPSTMTAALENKLISLVSTSAPATDQAPLPGALNVAVAVVYPMFDTAAQTTVIKFLTSNPEFKVVYDHQNVIVSDGHDTGGSGPANVQIWELETGGTIAIVGHIDPTVHV